MYARTCTWQLSSGLEPGSNAFGSDPRQLECLFTVCIALPYIHVIQANWSMHMCSSCDSLKASTISVCTRCDGNFRTYDWLYMQVLYTLTTPTPTTYGSFLILCCVMQAHKKGGLGSADSSHTRLTGRDGGGLMVASLQPRNAYQTIVSWKNSYSLQPT